MKKMNLFVIILTTLLVVGVNAETFASALTSPQDIHWTSYNRGSSFSLGVRWRWHHTTEDVDGFNVYISNTDSIGSATSYVKDKNDCSYNPVGFPRYYCYMEIPETFLGGDDVYFWVEAYSDTIKSEPTYECFDTQDLLDQVQILEHNVEKISEKYRVSFKFKPAVQTPVYHFSFNKTAPMIKVSGATSDSSFVYHISDTGTAYYEYHDPDVFEIVQIYASQNYIHGKRNSMSSEYYIASVDSAQDSTITASSNLETTGLDDRNKLDCNFNLFQNYPNPFNPTTTISYTLPQASHVSLTVYNLQGQTVAQVVNKRQTNGNHTVNFDGSHLPSGMYFYKLQSQDFIQVRKMNLMK